MINRTTAGGLSPRASVAGEMVALVVSLVQHFVVRRPRPNRARSTWINATGAQAGRTPAGFRAPARPG
jgi:hypothetical protein